MTDLNHGVSCTLELPKKIGIQYFQVWKYFPEHFSVCELEIIKSNKTE